MAVELIDKIITPDVAKQLDATIQQLNQVVDLIKQINAANLKIPASGGSSTGDAPGVPKGAKEKVDALTAAYEKLVRSQSELGRNLAIVNEATRQQNVVNAQNARQNLAASGSLDDLRARLAATTKAWDAMSAAERNNSAVGGQALNNIKSLQAQVRDLEQQTGRFQRNVGNYPQALGGFLSAAGIPGASSLSSIASSGLLLGGAAAVGAIGKEVFDVTLKLDNFNTSLRAVSKTEAEYAINQQFLKETTEKFGLSLLDIGAEFKNFYASATQAGLSADQARKIFSQVSEVSSVLKLSTSDTNSVLLAFSQILGKGKVAAQELRQQLGERIPGAAELMAKALGVSNAELNKLLEQGKVGIDALPKFSDLLEQTFGNGGKQVDSLQASIARLSNTFTDLVNNNESSLVRFFKNIVDGASSALNIIKDLTTSKPLTAADIAAEFGPDPSPIRNSDTDKQRLQKANEDFLKLANDYKRTNDTYIDNFRTYNKDLQKTTIESLQGDLVAYNKIYDETVKRSGKLSQDAISDLLELVKIKDRLTREQEIFNEKPTTTDNSTKLTDAQLAALARKRIEALAAIDDEELKRRQARDKAILEDAGQTTEQRLKAEQDYTDASNALADRKAKRDKDIIRQNIADHKDVAESLKAVDSKLATDRENIARQSGQDIKKILSDDLQDRVNAIKSNLQDALNTADREAADAASKEADRYAARRDEINATVYTNENQRRIDDEQNEERHQQNLLQITYEFARKKLLAQVDAQEQLINLDESTKNADGTPTDQEVKDRTTLNDLLNKLYILDVDNHAKAEQLKTKSTDVESKKQTQIEQEKQQKIRELGDKTLTFLQAAADASFERSKDQIQAQIDDLEIKKKAEEDAIDATSASDEEKTKKKAILDAQYDAQETQLKNKQRKLDEEKAKFDKAASIAHIIASTAEAVIATLARTPAPAGIPLAILVGTIGAAELATAIATPIPHYKHGKSIATSYAEMAVVGDGYRHEVLAGPNGKAYMTPDHPTVTEIPAHYRVFPSLDEYYKEIGHKQFWPVDGANMSVNNVDELKAEMTKQTATLVNELRANKQQVVVNATWGGIQVSFKTAAGQTDYLNKMIFGK